CCASNLSGRLQRSAGSLGAIDHLLRNYFVDDRHYTPCYVQASLIAIPPSGYRFRVARERFKLAEGCILPWTGSQNDRHNPSFAGFLTPKRRLSFNLVAVARLDKIRADEQQDYVRLFESLINLGAPFSPRRDLSIMPLQDAPVSFEYNQ